MCHFDIFKTFLNFLSMYFIILFSWLKYWQFSFFTWNLGPFFMSLAGEKQSGLFSGVWCWWHLSLKRGTEANDNLTISLDSLSFHLLRIYLIYNFFNKWPCMLICFICLPIKKCHNIKLIKMSVLFFILNMKNAWARNNCSQLRLILLQIL